MASAFEHVMDSNHWEFLDSQQWEFRLPTIGNFQLTKFMILELISAGLILLIYIPIARRARNGEPPRGFFWNTFESILTFLRDQVARPNLGHDADRFVPFLWTLFLFILFNNLLGMLPFFGAPTASITRDRPAWPCARSWRFTWAAMLKLGPCTTWKSLRAARRGPLVMACSHHADDRRHRGVRLVRQGVRAGGAVVRQHVRRAPGDRP